MVWIGGGIVIGLMAGETLCRHIGIVGWIVALVAIIDRMTKGQRKIYMFKFCRCPSGHGGMALHTNIIDPGNQMVGIGGSIVIGLMAGETLGRYIGIVIQIMTLITISDCMTKSKGKKE